MSKVEVVSQYIAAIEAVEAEFGSKALKFGGHQKREAQALLSEAKAKTTKSKPDAKAGATTMPAVKAGVKAVTKAGGSVAKPGKAEKAAAAKELAKVKTQDVVTAMVAGALEDRDEEEVEAEEESEAQE